MHLEDTGIATQGRCTVKQSFVKGGANRTPTAVPPPDGPKTVTESESPP